MNYYDAMLISCALALFVLVLMRFREVVLIKQAKAITEMEKAEQEDKERDISIPEDVLAIFSDNGRTFDGWIKLEDLNKLKRIYVAANQLMACNENDNVRLFAKLERAVNS